MILNILFLNESVGANFMLFLQYTMLFHKFSKSIYKKSILRGFSSDFLLFKETTSALKWSK